MSTSKSIAPSVVVMAGAGASAPLGYATLFDFETAIAQYAPKTTAKEKRELADLFRRIRESLVSKGEYTDFEAILWRFANYLDLCSNLRFDRFLEYEFLSTTSDRFRYSAFAQRIGEGQRIVDGMILDHYGTIPPDKDRYKAMAIRIWKALSSLSNLNGGFLDYYTTNYDIGPERIWEQVDCSADMPLVTGINAPTTLAGEWDERLLDIECKRRHGIYIHRLHGCVRWYRVSEEDSNGIHSKVIVKSDLVKKRGWEPCVMYPGRKLHTSEPPFSCSFVRLRNSLSCTSAVVIIGTSFRDNNLVEYLLEANDQRVNVLPIIIIDIADIRPRFFQRLKQVRSDTHFQYARKEWKVKFIVGNYLEDKILEELIQTLRDPQAIEVCSEDEEGQ